MIWQYSPYVIPFIACGLILAILGITGVRNRSCVCARSFSLLMFAGSLWAFCTALELSSADLQTQMLAILIEYPAMAIIPVAWLLFAFEYTGNDEWVTLKTAALLCIVPTFTVLMVATNPFHHLFYSTVTETMVDGLAFHVIAYGPAFWVHALYSYALIYLTILLILQRFMISPSVYRRQIVTILVATLIPLLFNLALVLRVGHLGLIDPTPFALMLSGFIVLFGMIRFQLFDITPIANEQILDNISDGVIVIDIMNRVIILNSPAERFLGTSHKKAIGVPITGILPDLPRGFSGADGSLTAAEQIHEIIRTIAGEKRHFEIRYLPLRSRGSGTKGCVIMVRDITGQKQTELALSAARKKLALLSNVTRHDILNQVTALLLNIEVAQDEQNEPAIRAWLEKQERAVTIIRHQIEFARDYESLGVSPPQWINLTRNFYDLRSRMADHGIALDILKEEIEVFGDPLLERVSFNFVDNSIRHGGHVTAIRIRSERTAEGLMVTYEDNGTGIPTSNKERIFQRGFGTENGLGLFLVWEILGITGMTIRECGVPGKGVRFEIQIPAGQFRIKP
ncbi:histidine kinase N-terminal 7TM domain-containing protein [Methanoregula sp.]|uniref:histidine kinase N-terminal 7TM domain-containing protein n=1 Tax=Methanoregula sp. TaxID=2052170 RepID=UPI003567C7A8